MFKKCALFLFALFLYSSVQAQWVQTNGPEGGKIYAFAADSTAIYAGTNSGIFKSANHGNTWLNITTGINFSYANKGIYSIATTKNHVFVGTSNSGIFYTNDQGSTWTSPSVLNSSSIEALAASGDTVIAVTSSSVFLSSNLGSSWMDITNGLSTSNINSVLINGSTIFVGTYGGGIYFTSNGGSNWSTANIGLGNQNVLSLNKNSSILYACTENGIFSSSNNGASWSLISTGLSGYFNRIAFIGTKLFTCGGNGVFVSSNNGISWTNINPTVFILFPQSLFNWGSNLFLGLGGNGVYLSQNDGTSWMEKNTGLISTEIFSLAGNSSNLYASVPTAGVFHSSTNGSNWSKLNNGLSNLIINKVALNGAMLYACTSSGLYASVNGGSNWTANNLIGQSNISCIAFNGSNIYCGSSSGSGVYYSNNNGVSWVSINNGLSGNDILSIAVIGTTLFAGTASNGVYVSTNNGTNWGPANSGLSGAAVYALEPSGSGMLAGTDYGVFFSSNNGSSWVQWYNSGYSVEAISTMGVNIFIGVIDKVYMSQNSGSTWMPVDTGLPVNSTVRSLTCIGSFIYAGTTEGVWIRPLFELLGTTLVPHVDSIKGTSCYGGQDGYASVSVSGGTAPYTYSWTPSGGNGSSATGLSSGTYTVYMEDSVHAQTLATVFIPQPANLTGTLSLVSSSCIINNGSALLTPSGGTPPYSYLWSSADTTSSINGIGPGIYTVQLGDSNACSTTLPFTIGVVTYPTAAPSICLTTVDSLSEHNLIVWEKDPLITYIDSFRIYRLDASNYNYVASVSYNQLSEYTDVDPTADPQANIRRYKLATVDVCGTVSSLSDFHTTILLTDFQNGIFQYTPYDIQNQSATLVQQYLLQRLDSSTGIWTTINTNPGSVTGTIIAPNYAAYSYSSYRILADLGSYICTPTARASGITTSRSNIKNRALGGIKNDNLSEERVEMFPNPSKESVTILSDLNLHSVQVYDVLGRVAVSKLDADSKEKNTTLDISMLVHGVYTVICKGSDFEVRKKLVVE
ncbi:MAG: T9SS type A sorting domain-containing protein [Bacteroidetes bacterium]|nr:T9SS type A sorting domain-containing protein [Bacteroidota bacterium]